VKPLPRTPLSAKKEVWILALILLGVAGFFVWGGNPLQLTGQAVGGSLGGKGMPVLGACTGREEEDLYAIVRTDLQYPEPPDVIDMWTEKYHQQVNVIVDEYIANSEREIDCLAFSVENLTPPGGQMLELAAKLPPWENAARRAQLSAVDTAAVLLEFLRTYECALTERYFFLFGDVTKEMREIYTRKDNDDLLWSEVIREFVEQYRKIGFELAVARPAMHRVLTVTSGRGRLSGLDMEAECFYRATMDLRNAMSLAAEASACFPRVQDVKDPLRDYK
jgi:hypothetical protein